VGTSPSLNLAVDLYLKKGYEHQPRVSSTCTCSRGWELSTLCLFYKTTCIIRLKQANSCLFSWRPGWSIQKFPRKEETIAMSSFHETAGSCISLPISKGRWNIIWCKGQWKPHPQPLLELIANSANIAKALTVLEYASFSEEYHWRLFWSLLRLYSAWRTSPSGCCHPKYDACASFPNLLRRDADPRGNLERKMQPYEPHECNMLELLS